MNTEPSDRIIAALIDRGLIDPARRTEAQETVRTTLGPEVDQPVDHAARVFGLPKLVEVVAYLGAALVVAAIFLLISQEWENLGETGQVLALGGVTVILAIAGIVAAMVGHPSPTDDIRRRLSSTLLTAAAIGAGLTLGRWLDTMITTDYQDVAWHVVGGGLLTLLLAALVYLRWASAFGQVAILGSAMATIFALSNAVPHYYVGIFVGTLILVLGLVWLTLAETSRFREQNIAQALGVAVALWGAQFPVIEGSTQWYGYLLTALLVALCVFLYLRKVSWPYVAAAVIGVTLVVPEVITDWTDGSLPLVGGVLLAGVTLLIASFLGYRLKVSATDEN